MVAAPIFDKSPHKSQRKYRYGRGFVNSECITELPLGNKYWGETLHDTHRPHLPDTKSVTPVNAAMGTSSSKGVFEMPTSFAGKANFGIWYSRDIGLSASVNQPINSITLCSASYVSLPSTRTWRSFKILTWESLGFWGLLCPWYGWDIPPDCTTY